MQRFLSHFDTKMLLVWMLVRLIFLCLSVHILEGSDNDPCNKKNHEPFGRYRMGSRNEKCDVDGTITQLCDFFVKDNWYVIPNATLLNHRPKIGRCGVAYPAWMNGSFPKVVDGIVDRDICIREHTDYCASNITIQIKNCKLYFVYYLKQMQACGQAYCIESQLPCKEPDTTTLPSITQPGMHFKSTTTAADKNEDSTKYILIGIASGVGVVLCFTAVIVIVVIKNESCKRKRRNEIDPCDPPPYEIIEGTKINK